MLVVLAGSSAAAVVMQLEQFETHQKPLRTTLVQARLQIQQGRKVKWKVVAVRLEFHLHQQTSAPLPLP